MIHTKTNAQLLKEFDKHVIGHTEAKKMLISMVNRSKTAHYHRYKLGEKREIETINCMLLGKSGTGKTFLVNTLQKLAVFPLIRVDATKLEPASKESNLGPEGIKKLIVANAKRLLKEKSEHFFSINGIIDQTIVFIDEIDKLAKGYDSSGNWNNQVQSSLLTLIESVGTFKNVSFILAGAFSDMETNTDISNSIGFFKQDKKEQTRSIDRDIINYGLKPELIGRLNSITQLDTLEYSTMETILNNILLPQKQELLNECYGLNTPLLTGEEKKTLINTAMASDQGVRSLKRELDTIFADIEFNFEVRR